MHTLTFRGIPGSLGKNCWFRDCPWTSWKCQSRSDLKKNQARGDSPKEGDICRYVVTFKQTICRYHTLNEKLSTKNAPEARICSKKTLPNSRICSKKRPRIAEYVQKMTPMGLDPTTSRLWNFDFRVVGICVTLWLHLWPKIPIWVLKITMRMISNNFWK